jgi:hypothetical protein
MVGMTGFEPATPTSRTQGASLEGSRPARALLSAGVALETLHAVPIGFPVRQCRPRIGVGCSEGSMAACERPGRWS